MTAPPVVVVECYPHTYGGSQAVARLHCAEVRRAGGDARLLVTGPGPLVDRALADGTPVTQLDPPPALQRYGRTTTGLHAVRALLAVPRLWRQVRDLLAPDRPSVHVHDHRGMLLVAPGARWAGCRVVWHVHSVDRRRWLNGICGRLAHRAVAPSRSVLTLLDGLPGRLPVDVIANPVDPQVLELAATGHGHPPLDPPLIVTAARLHPDKGVDVLLEAIALVRAVVPGVRVEVYGGAQPGWDHHEAALRAQRHALGLDRVVELVGFIRDPQARWRRAAAYVQPSRTEARPLAILEAMVLGLPVVATDVGGLGELVDHERTGLLVPPEDPRALADALVRVLTDRALAERLADAARAVRAEVDVASYAAAIGRTHLAATRR